MIRVGMLGTARIARAFLGTPLRNAEIVAIASREKARADSFAKEFNLPKSYGSYQELIDDPSIDAVYIPLPQHLHCEFVLKAAHAGKHVLVEKPAALSMHELEEMESACTKQHVLYMEAFMYRFKQIHLRVKELVDSGVIGEIRHVDFNWSINIGKLLRSDFRLDPERGGGALYDLGVYGADFLQFLIGTPVEILSSFIQKSNTNGVDLFSHTFCKAGGVLSTVMCGFTLDANHYSIGGETGSIYVPGSLSGRQVTNKLFMHLLVDDERKEEVFAPENPYTKELEYFADCISQKKTPVPGFIESRSVMKFLEDARSNAKELSARM